MHDPQARQGKTGESCTDQHDVRREELFHVMSVDVRTSPGMTEAS